MLECINNKIGLMKKLKSIVKNEYVAIHKNEESIPTKEFQRNLGVQDEGDQSGLKAM